MKMASATKLSMEESIAWNSSPLKKCFVYENSVIFVQLKEQPAVRICTHE